MLGAKAETEMRHVIAGIRELSEKAKETGVALVLPSQERLDELGELLESFPPDAIREGLKVRDGKAYGTLRERGAIVKRNFENRSEIAKLLVLCARMGEDERKAALGAIAAGAVREPLRITTLAPPDRAKLLKFMKRSGIPCVLEGDMLCAPPADAAMGEVRLEMPGRLVWVEESAKPTLEANLRRMRDLNAHIQLKNAERQIKVFTEDEESRFAELQREYLGLLKEQDEILREYNLEDGISVKR